MESMNDDGYAQTVYPKAQRPRTSIGGILGGIINQFSVWSARLIGASGPAPGTGMQQTSSKNFLDSDDLPPRDVFQRPAVPQQAQHETYSRLSRINKARLLVAPPEVAHRRPDADKQLASLHERLQRHGFTSDTRNLVSLIKFRAEVFEMQVPDSPGHAVKTSVSTSTKLTTTPQPKWVTELSQQLNDVVKLTQDGEQLHSDDLTPFYNEVSRKAIVVADKDQFEELTDDAKQVIKRAMTTKRGETIIDKFGIDIQWRDLNTLCGTNWLNDEVINFYMALIKQRSAANPEMPSVHIYLTAFYSKLKKDGYASVRRWTKRVKLFEHDLALIPLHFGNHWAMLSIDFREKTVHYFDSLHSSGTKTLNDIRKYLQDESWDKLGKDFDFGGWRFEARGDAPSQENGYDCGVFACTNAEYLSRNRQPDFEQVNMRYLRQRMIYEICTAQLMDR